MDNLDLLRTEIDSGERFKTVLQGFDKRQVTDTVTQLIVENSELTKQLEKARTENTNLKKQLRDLQRESAENAPQVDVQAIQAKAEAKYKAQLEDMAAQLREAKAAAARPAPVVPSQSDTAAAEAKYKAQLDEMSAKLRQTQAELRAAQEAAARADTGDSSAAEPKNDIGAKFVVEELKAQIVRLNEEKRKRGMRITELEELVQQEKDDASGKIAMLAALNDNVAAVLQLKLTDLNDFASSWKDAFSATTSSL